MSTLHVTEVCKYDFKSEEDVKIHYAIPTLESLGYKKECMDFEKTIKIHEGTKKKNIFADIVVYTSKNKETPLVVIDTKAPNEILDRNDKEQVISYARLLPKIAPLAVLTNGFSTQIYQTLDKTRIRYLPKRSELISNFVNVVISAGIEKTLKAEAKKQLFIVEDVGTFKTLLSRCHKEIRNNEGCDPIKAFDELSKVLFAKMYEEQYKGENTRFTTETYKITKRDLGINIVEQIFSEIQEVPEYSDLFAKGATIELQDRTIETIVATFENYDLTLTRFDVKGEAFEHFLGDTFTGGLGQFFTPRNVVEFIVDAISPKIGDKIIDPFCGTGGFLIYAFEVISEKIRLHEFSKREEEKWRKKLSNESLFGTDWIERTTQACKMNMVVHGDGNTGVFKQDGFLNIQGIIDNDTFDICLTNPPFGSTETDSDILEFYELGQGRNSQDRKILALERAIKLVHPDGIIGIIIDDGVLNNDSADYVRSFLHREVDLLCVVGLNKETFQGYGAEAKTSILIMKKKNEPSDFQKTKVFMAVCENSGYSTKGLQIPGNELPDILFDFKKYTASGDEDFIHKRTRIVDIDDPYLRLDAESYIPAVIERSVTEPTNITINMSSHLEFLGQMILDLEAALSKYTKFGKYETACLNDLLEPVSNWITLLPSQKYPLIGMHQKGEGLFIRETKYGSEIKAKKLNKLSENWFIYSRLFARRGSFAIVEPEFDCGYVSNEFPTFRVIYPNINSIELINYIIFYLNTPNVLAWIESQCTGQTKESRARFKEKKLLSIVIPIPVDIEIINIVNKMRQFSKFSNILSLTSSDLPGLIEPSIPKLIL